MVMELKVVSPPTRDPDEIEDSTVR